MLMKETQPLRFFGAIARGLCLAGLALMAPVLVEYAETGLVPRMPTWVLSLGLLMFSAMMVVSGLILDSVSRGRAEQKRIFYLSMPAQAAARERRSRSRGRCRQTRSRLARRMSRLRAFCAGRRRRLSSPMQRCWRCCSLRHRWARSWRALLSIGIALAITWLLNRHLTFEPSRRGLRRRRPLWRGRHRHQRRQLSRLLRPAARPARPAAACRACARLGAAMALSFSAIRGWSSTAKIARRRIGRRRGDPYIAARRPASGVDLPCR